MDLVVSHLKHPWQQVTRALTSLLSSLFFFTVAWYSWKLLLRMHGYETTSPTMEIPMYIAYLPIPVFSGFIGIRFMIKAIGFFKAVLQRPSAPEVI